MWSTARHGNSFLLKCLKHFCCLQAYGLSVGHAHLTEEACEVSNILPDLNNC